MEQALLFLLDTVFSLFFFVFLLRLLLQWSRANFRNPLATSIVQASNWLVLPLRRVLPGLGGYDWASLVGACLVGLLSIALQLAVRSVFAVEPWLLLSALSIVHWILYGLIILLFVDVIFSWVNPHAPLAPMVRAMNEPLMRPLRRFIPPVGGVDLSSLVAFLILRIAVFLADNLIYSL